MNSEPLIHTIAPIYAPSSKVLLLGTFPSPKSRESGFYYGHPQNRFWKVMADLCNSPLPLTKEEKIDFLLHHHIALWDVLHACSITGAKDSSIQEPVANDLRPILQKTAIKKIFTTGSKAAALYQTYCLEQTGIRAIALPSTSPANCRVTYDQLYTAYRAILPYLECNMTKS